MDQLSFDYTYALAANLPAEKGVTERELAAFADPSSAALARLLARRDRESAWIERSQDEQTIERLLDYAASMGGRFRNVVVLAVGGAARANKALVRALASPYQDRGLEGPLPRLFVLDDVDPD